MEKLVVMIDGGHLRALARLAKKAYNPNSIEKFALACKGSDEDILRVLYYDCAPFQGEGKLPVSGEKKAFTGDGTWMHKLAEKELFAVRAGQLKFRGFVLDSIPAKKEDLADKHFRPVFQQKGVDMRIGLDIATYSACQAAKRMALVIGDTDLVPAMKHARKSGLQVVLIQVDSYQVAPELRRHADFIRSIKFAAAPRASR